jgi:hypothetical protein
MQFWFDYDTVGQKKSKEFLLKNKPVFLWKKYLKSLNIVWDEDKKLDLTDLVIYSREHGIKLTSFNEGFSSNKLDLYYL